MKKRLLSTLLAFCLTLALLPGTALAANKSGTCGANAAWTLDSAGTMTITGTGAMTDYRDEDGHWEDFRDDIKKVVVQKGITTIGNYAFRDCKNVTSVTLPSGVTSIGHMAFRDCHSLSSINLPSTINKFGSYAFSHCTSLTSVTIPNGLPYLEMGVFYDCSSLTSVVIPSSAQSLGMYSFGSCTSLTSVNIPYGVKLVGDGAFYGCSNLASVGFPSTLTRVGVTAFSHCDALKDVYYASTKNQWDKIEMDVNPSGNPLKTATKHYNSVLPTPKTYTVTFNANNGSVTTKNKSVTSGGTYGELPAPTRTGYIFDGWYTALTGGTKITSSSKVNLMGNQTLYAHWTKAAAKTMTVTFDPNSGTTTTKTKTVTSGSTYGTLPAPTRTGYIFDGWYTSKTGGTKVTSATKVTKTANHTLYAHWSKSRIITVTFDAAGGDVLTEYQTAITGTRYRHLPTPARASYHFDGWYTKPTGGVKVTEAAKVTNSVTTLYARWTKTNPTVKGRQNGNYQVVIPEDYKVLLYGSETTATVAKTALAQTGDYTVTCTKMAKLSNGTVRYYGKFPKVSSTTSYWFTYSDEMYIN